MKTIKHIAGKVGEHLLVHMLFQLLWWAFTHIWPVHGLFV